MTARIACLTCRSVQPHVPSRSASIQAQSFRFPPFVSRTRARKVVSSPRMTDRRGPAGLPNPLDFQKCDSAVPRCGRCVQSDVLECIYDQTRKKRPGNALATGEACLACRLVAFPDPSRHHGPEATSLDADGTFSSFFSHRAKKKVRPSKDSLYGND